MSERISLRSLDVCLLVASARFCAVRNHRRPQRVAVPQIPIACHVRKIHGSPKTREETTTSPTFSSRHRCRPGLGSPLAKPVFCHDSARTDTSNRLLPLLATHNRARHVESCKMSLITSTSLNEKKKNFFFFSLSTYIVAAHSIQKSRGAKIRTQAC